MVRVDERLAALGLGVAFLPIALTPCELDAQRVDSVATDSARITVPTTPRKSPAVAGLIGLILPGSGHWYAQENGRGWLIATVYFVGAAISWNGHTDIVGKVGGAMALGAIGVSVIDGSRAAGRYNGRRGLLAAERPPQRGRALGLGANRASAKSR